MSRLIGNSRIDSYFVTQYISPIGGASSGVSTKIHVLTGCFKWHPCGHGQENNDTIPWPSKRYKLFDDSLYN